MQWPSKLEPRRKDAYPHVSKKYDAPKPKTEEALSHQTDQAMDGFEEWLRDFKEELARRGWPADR